MTSWQQPVVLLLLSLPCLLLLSSLAVAESVPHNGYAIPPSVDLRSPLFLTPSAALLATIELMPTLPVPEWMIVGLAANVCSIPAAQGISTRASALRGLADSVVESLNATAAPCDNFYKFACGGWLSRNNQSTLPPDESSWSKTFSDIDKRNERILQEVMDCARIRLFQEAHPTLHVSQDDLVSFNKSHNASAPIDQSWLLHDFGAAAAVVPAGVGSPPVQPPLNLQERLIGAFFAACMDQKRIDALGLAPVQPLLDLIDNAQSIEALVRDVPGELAWRHTVSLFWSFSLGVNTSDPNAYAFNFGQDGSPLARDLLVGPANVTAAYAQHTERLLQLMGVNDTAEAKREAATIVAIQVDLARLWLEPEEMRVPERLVNAMTVQDASQLGGNHSLLNLTSFLVHATRKPASFFEGHVINVAQPRFFAGLSDILRKYSLQELKQYARLLLVQGFAADLPSPFAQATFDFFGRQLRGTKQQPSRQRVCNGETQAMLSDALSQRFVNLSFTPRAANQSRELMKHIQRAFLSTLPTLSWMTDADKQSAADKLAGMFLLVGSDRPEQMLNYSSVRDAITPTSHWNNTQALLHLQYLDVLRKWPLPVERDRFSMTASTVNAYYDPSLNSMNFPAGIVQPPFFSEFYPSAWNFGAIGSVMGHELTHGFDDEGRKFDAKGALRNWWSNETANAFARGTDCLVRQYSEYNLTVSPANGSAVVQQHPAPRIRGFLTLGENLADQGGVTLSHRALDLMREEELNHTAPRVDEAEASQAAWRDMQEANPALKQLNDEQLFFVAYAQSWCRVVRPESLLRTLATDPHSPAEARVNIPLGNLEAFHKAFQCKPRGTEAANCTLW